MASSAEQQDCHFHRNHAAYLIHAATAPVSSLISPIHLTASSQICVPLKFAVPDQFSSSESRVKSVSSPTESSSGFPSTVRIAGLSSNGKRGGPAFVGQVFSMCDLTGTGLMAVSTHFDIPFISKRTPEWLKKVFANITKSERNGPVFRFFMDLGDAVSYVKKLNIPSGVVGACRLDLAYELLKEKPHMFQFVPNERQVKAANNLLKKISQNGEKRKIDGVPVFGAQNLDIAVATADGIKWYTPYFFDKAMLDNILEESVDQHFHALIQNRHMQRRRDVVDDSMGADVIEEMGDSMLEPPEVQEVMDEIGNPGIPLSVVSKAAEIQLFYAIDKVLLGNRWLRKATGIQPKFPYMVDSFERRSAFSLLRSSEAANCLGDSETNASPSQSKLEDKDQTNNGEGQSFQVPFGDWFSLPWSMQGHKTLKGSSDAREKSPEFIEKNWQLSPFLPKITMVGISTGEAGQMSKATLKKTMEDLTRDLEQSDQGNVNAPENFNNELRIEARDPLFVANVGDHYTGLAKAGSARWVRRGTDQKTNT